MADLTFNQLQIPGSFTPDEISKIQGVLSANPGASLADYHAADVNKYLANIDQLRAAGSTANASNAFNNLIQSLGAVSRNMSRGMSYAQAQAGSASGLNQEITDLGKLVSTSQQAQKLTQGPNAIPGIDEATLAKAAQGDPVASQVLAEAQRSQQQLTTQNQQLADFRKQAETQAFGGTGLTLSDALSSTKGDIGNLNQFLGQQEANTFNTQLKPLIQMALGAQGLSDSGANVELQSKALAQLEQARQQNMMQAALGTRANIQGLQRSDLLGGIGQAQQNLTSSFDLQRAGITMQFQQQLERQREQLARELSARQGGGGGNIMGGILQGGLSGAAAGSIAGPWGALIGGALGAAGGGYSASQGQGGGNSIAMGAAGGQLGSSFFANNPSYFKPVSYAPGGDMYGQGVMR